MAFELRQYAVAVDLLEEEYEKTNDQNARARIAYTIGESFWKMGEVSSAIPWYNKAIINDFGPRAKEKKAFGLKQLQEYSSAINLFNELISEGSQQDVYRREIAICRLASDWLNSKNNKYLVTKGLFNSRQSDYAPFFLDEHRVFFSSDRANGTSEEKYNWTGRDYSDIYVYDEYSGEISHLDPIINTKHNEGTASLTPDGRVLFFTRCFSDESADDFCKLYISNYNNNKWTKPRVLPFIKENVNYGHPYWVQQDSLLFFSNNQTSGFGGFDLYFTKLAKTGEWVEPVNLGNSINTIGDEKFPSLKNDTLFFASDGHPGMGGLDIFYSYIDENGRWERPFNMKHPINSGADDFGIVFQPGPFGIQENGYFTSGREGDDDIYAFEENRNIIVQETDSTSTDEESIEYALKLAVTVLKEDEDGNKDIFPDAKLQINQKSEKINKKGFILKDIDEGNYTVTVNSPGYFSVSESIVADLSDVKEGDILHTYNKTIILKPIIKGKEIVLENIFYDFNKSFIRDDAKPSLNELVSLLNANPEINIELSSHTDCRGPDPYNLKLSQDRAEAAVQYMITAGINSNRITAKGYGETSPMINCVCDNCTEDQHQKNRRTSFKIIDLN